jgi:hypothetical protein
VQARRVATSDGPRHGGLPWQFAPRDKNAVKKSEAILQMLDNAVAEWPKLDPKTQKQYAELAKVKLAAIAGK